MHMLGKLSLSVIPTSPIILGASAFMGLCALAVVFALFYYKKWGWLWKEWLTTVDHKKNRHYVPHWWVHYAFARFF